MKSTNQRDHCEWGDLYPQVLPSNRLWIRAALFWLGRLIIWVSGQNVTIPGEQQAVMIYFFLYALMNSIWFWVLRPFFFYFFLFIFFILWQKCPFLHSSEWTISFSSLCVYVSCWVKFTMLVCTARGFTLSVHSVHWHCHTVNHSTVNRYFVSQLSPL